MEEKVMKEESTITLGNKLIEIFIGNEVSGDTVVFKSGQRVHISESNHHLSWDRLMPVIEQIKLKGFNTRLSGNIDGDGEMIIWLPSAHAKAIAKISSSVPLNAAWLAVVKFITWYNENIDVCGDYAEREANKEKQAKFVKENKIVTEKRKLVITMLPAKKANYDDNEANQLGLHKNNYLQVCKGYNKEIEELYPPQELYIISDSPVTKPKQGAAYIPECNNEEINGIPFIYLCDSPDGTDLVCIEAEGEKITTTMTVFNKAKRILASTDKELTPENIMPDVLKSTYAKYYNENLGIQNITITLPVSVKDGYESLKTKEDKTIII